MLGISAKHVSEKHVSLKLFVFEFLCHIFVKFYSTIQISEFLRMFLVHISEGGDGGGDYLDIYPG